VLVEETLTFGVPDYRFSPVNNEKLWKLKRHWPLILLVAILAKPIDPIA
jgi:hypothetical protein